MIATVLNALGFGEPLPDDANERAAQVANERRQVDATEADALEAANTAIAKAKRDAADKRAALAKRAEAHAVSLADKLAKDALASLVPLFVSFHDAPSRALALDIAATIRQLDTRSQQQLADAPSRALALDIAATIRQLDTRSQQQLAAAMSPWSISVAAASAIVKARPAALSAYVADDGLKGDALAAATRLLSASLTPSPAAATAYDLVLELEAALEARATYAGGHPLTDEETEQWEISRASWRPGDRAERLQACAERWGAKRQRAFEADYKPATGPIVPHTRQPGAEF